MQTLEFFPPTVFAIWFGADESCHAPRTLLRRCRRALALALAVRVSQVTAPVTKELFRRPNRRQKSSIDGDSIVDGCAALAGNRCDSRLRDYAFVISIAELIRSRDFVMAPPRQGSISADLFHRAAPSR